MRVPRLALAAVIVVILGSGDVRTKTKATWTGGTLEASVRKTCASAPCWTGREECCEYLRTSLWASDPANERVVYFDGMSDTFGLFTEDARLWSGSSADGGGDSAYATSFTGGRFALLPNGALIYSTGGSVLLYAQNGSFVGTLVSEADVPGGRLTISCLYVEPNERCLFVCNGATRQLLLFKMTCGLGLRPDNDGSAVFDRVAVNMTTTRSSEGYGDDVLVDMAMGPEYELDGAKRNLLYVLARSSAVWGVWRLNWHTGLPTVTLEGGAEGGSGNDDGPIAILESIDGNEDEMASDAGFASLEVLGDGAFVVTPRTLADGAGHWQRNISLVAKYTANGTRVGSPLLLSDLMGTPLEAVALAEWGYGYTNAAACSNASNEWYARLGPNGLLYVTSSGPLRRPLVVDAGGESGTDRGYGLLGQLGAHSTGFLGHAAAVDFSRAADPRASRLSVDSEGVFRSSEKGPEDVKLAVTLIDAAGRSFNGSAELEVLISGAVIVDYRYQIYERHKQTRDVKIRTAMERGDAPHALMTTAGTGVREAVLHQAVYQFPHGPYNVSWTPDLASLTWVNEAGRSRGACGTRLNKGDFSWLDGTEQGGAASCDDLAFTAELFLRVGADLVTVGKRSFSVEPKELTDYCIIQHRDRLVLRGILTVSLFSIATVLAAGGFVYYWRDRDSIKLAQTGFLYTLLISCGLIGVNGVVLYATYYPGTIHHVLLTQGGCCLRLVCQYAGMSLMLTAVWRKTRVLHQMSADRLLRQRVCDGERLFGNLRGVLEMGAVLTPVVIWLAVWTREVEALNTADLRQFCRTMYCKYHSSFWSKPLIAYLLGLTCYTLTLSRISQTIHDAFGERQIMYPLLVGIWTIFGAFYVLQYTVSIDEDDPWRFMLLSSVIWSMMCFYTVYQICATKFYKAYYNVKVSVDEFDELELKRWLETGRQEAQEAAVANLNLAEEEPIFGIKTRTAGNRWYEANKHSAELSKYSFVFADVDFLHQLNENLGYERVNMRIKQTFKMYRDKYHSPPDCVVFRWFGGDEFGLITPVDLARARLVGLWECFRANGMSITGSAVQLRLQPDMPLHESKPVLNAIQAVQDMKKAGERGQCLWLDDCYRSVLSAAPPISHTETNETLGMQQITKLKRIIRKHAASTGDESATDRSSTTSSNVSRATFTMGVGWNPFSFVRGMDDSEMSMSTERNTEIAGNVCDRRPTYERSLSGRSFTDNPLRAAGSVPRLARPAPRPSGAYSPSPPSLSGSQSSMFTSDSDDRSTPVSPTAELDKRNVSFQTDLDAVGIYGRSEEVELAAMPSAAQGHPRTSGTSADGETDDDRSRSDS